MFTADNRIDNAIARIGLSVGGASVPHDEADASPPPDDPVESLEQWYFLRGGSDLRDF